MSNALAIVDNSDGRDKASGRFVSGNAFGGKGGRPVGSKPRLAQAFIDKLAKHWDKHGDLAIKRLFQDDVSTYCKLIAHLIPKDILIEVNHHIELKAEIEAFTASYTQCQAMIGADIEDAHVIDDAMIDDHAPCASAEVTLHGPDHADHAMNYAEPCDSVRHSERTPLR
jgi:hypothetical protein